MRIIPADGSYEGLVDVQNQRGRRAAFRVVPAGPVGSNYKLDGNSSRTCKSDSSRDAGEAFASITRERENQALSDVAESDDGRDSEVSYRRERTLSEVAALKERLGSPEFVLDPTSKLVQKWDGITFVALIFTAIMAPVEVAFCVARPLKIP